MEEVKKIRIVSRNSPLALLQVEELISLFPSFEYELNAYSSFGDKNKYISLMENIAGDFFTREFDSALLNNQADISIHSAKDLPYPLPAGLELFCLTKAFDKTDSLVSKNNQTLLQLPSGARIGTSSKVRKEELLSLRSDLAVVSIRGTIEERIELVDNGHIDALIVATCALKRLGLANRIAQILPFKTHPLQGNLAVIGRQDDQVLKRFFATQDVRQKYGKVTLVGFGPGNADLLTIGGEKALQKADIIFHDDLLDQDFLNHYAAKKIYVGKRKDKHSYHQNDINELLYEAAISGKTVVRLKGGDPMIFAHGREEIDFLQSRFVQVEVIPGVTSALALSAFTHIPLTHRQLASSVAFVTGHAVENVANTKADTMVIYMGGSTIGPIAQKLIETGKNPKTPVALVHNVSLPSQQTFFSTLDELQNTVYKFPTPILIIVGEVVNLEQGNSAQEKILATGTSIQENRQSGKITHTQLIKVEKNATKEVKATIENMLGSFNWIIFTSRYGVNFFFEILDELRVDIRSILNVKIASVGKTTSAELQKFHLYPDLESITESAEGIVSYFEQNGITNQDILLPRSDKGLRFLSDKLLTLGNRVTDLPVYTNTVNEKAEKVDISEFNKILFSSPSCVDAFLAKYGSLPQNAQLIAKGKTTKNRIEELINEKI